MGVNNKRQLLVGLYSLQFNSSHPLTPSYLPVAAHDTRHKATFHKHFTLQCILCGLVSGSDSYHTSVMKLSMCMFIHVYIC